MNNMPKSEDKKRKASDAIVAVPTKNAKKPQAEVELLSSVKLTIREMFQQNWWTEDEEAVCDALKRLSSFCENDEFEVQEELCGPSTNGLLIIRLTLKIWEKSPNVQAQGCRFIWSTLENVYTDFAVPAVKMGVMDAVLDAMKSFPDKRDVQEYGCLALMNLTKENNENSKYFVVHLCGLSTVVAASKKYTEKCGHWVGLLLDNLSECIQYKASIIEAQRVVSYHKNIQK